jgi:hypothetical protein
MTALRPSGTAIVRTKPVAHGRGDGVEIARDVGKRIVPVVIIQRSENSTNAQICNIAVVGLE